MSLNIYIIYETDKANLDANDVIEIPVTPQDISISSSQDNRKFETVKLGTIVIPGNLDPKTVSWSSFFPSRSYNFAINEDYEGFDIIEKIESFRAAKVPVRLMITETNINDLFVIDSFEYGSDRIADIPYSITLVQFRIPDVSII